MSTAATTSRRNSIHGTKRLRFQDLFLGRDEEILKLEGIFRRTTASPNKSGLYPNLVLVGGASGTGKSTLVSRAKDHLYSLEEEFFWISGKFANSIQAGYCGNESDSTVGLDQPDIDDKDLHPFAAIVDAFSYFCQELMNEPDTLEEVKLDILEAIGDQGAVLTNMIPSLAELINIPPSRTSIHGTTELRYFHAVFQKFIQALANSHRTLVLVLDDIHRADAASLELLFTLFTNSELKHVMFIGTYRTEEVTDPEHYLNLWIDRIEEAQQEVDAEQPGRGLEHPPGNRFKTPLSTSITRMSLPGLELGTTNLLISRVLELEPNDTMDLAHIVYTKTSGNTYFTVQFLRFLKDDALLWVHTEDDGKAQYWTWDAAAIRKEAAITTTLVDFMRDKISSFPAATKLLPVAACFGGKFSRDMLTLIMADISQLDGLQDYFPSSNLSNEEDLLNSLKICENEGFIENCGNRKYRFTHDKVTEAALTVHPQRAMKRIKCEVGSILVQKLDAEELEENIFVVVELLNFSKKAILDPITVARMNLKAAEKAKRLAAFPSASAYVYHAFFYLSKCSEDDMHRTLLLDISSMGAEVEIAIGDLDRMQRYCNAIFDSNHQYTTLEQLRVQNVLIDSSAYIGGKMNTSLNLCIQVLDELGCAFPSTTFGKGLRSATALLKSKSPKNIPLIEDIENMTLMKDHAKVESMKLLDRASTYSYLVGNHFMLLLCTTRMVRWTIRYGICDKSPSAFAGVGLIMMHVMGDWTAGERYGELALSMLQKLETMATEDESQRVILTQSKSRSIYVANAFVLYWIKPLTDYTNELHEGYIIGMRAGDLESAFWSAFFHLAAIFKGGKPLKDVEALCRKYVSQMSQLQRRETESLTRIYWQGFLNLMGTENVGTTELTGSIMDEKDAFNDDGTLKFKPFPTNVYMMQIILCAFFGEYEKGADLAIEWGDAALVESPGGLWTLSDPFARGLCLYAAAEKNSIKKRLYRRHAEKCRSTLKAWAHKGAQTTIHQLMLLDAEHEAGAGKEEAAKTHFLKSCVSAAAYVQDAALANERFATFLFKIGDADEGKNRLLMSIALYRDWGANAKVEKLLQEYPNLSGLPAKAVGRNLEPAIG